MTGLGLLLIMVVPALVFLTVHTVLVKSVFKSVEIMGSVDVEYL